MPGYTKEEARAFLEAMRLAVSGKVGFKWMVEKLADLSAFIESITEENDRLNAYIDRAGARADYERHANQRSEEK